jgi:hypothetical protein
MSETTRALLGSAVPDGVRVRTVGPHRLKDIDQPEELHELRIEGVTVTDATVVPADPVPPTAPSRSGPPGAPPALPDLRTILDGLPDFVLDAADLNRPGHGSTRDVIEQRVLRQLRDTMKGSRGRSRRLTGPFAPPTADGPKPAAAISPPASSLAEDLERLRTLRDAGALTDEQYARAVDRVLESEA